MHSTHNSHSKLICTASDQFTVGLDDAILIPTGTLRCLSSHIAHMWYWTDIENAEPYTDYIQYK